MAIVINTLSISRNRGGTKTYLKNIVDNMVLRHRDTDFVILCSKTSYPQFEFLKKYPNIDFQKIGLSTANSLVRIVADQIIIPILLYLKYRRGGHILITPSSIGTIFSPIPQVVIIQAALFLKNIRNELPEGGRDLFSFFHRWYYDTFLPISLERCQQVVTVSRYLKNKVLELKPGISDKVEVVYEGVDREVFTDINSKAGEESSYILFVSTLFPYKNADRLIEVFGKLSSEGNLPENCRLKIIGKDPSGGRELERLRGLAEQFDVIDKTDFPGQVSHQTIHTFYRNAFVFVYPSAVESFGLPPLEAMACGVPVVASNRMAVPEVVGDAGLIVDPDDTHDLATSIQSLFENQELRSRLIERGLKRATEFTWEEAADGLFGMCQKVLRQK